MSTRSSVLRGKDRNVQSDNVWCAALNASPDKLFCSPRGGRRRKVEAFDGRWTVHHEASHHLHYSGGAAEAL